MEERHRKLRFEELQRQSKTQEMLKNAPRLPLYVILENIRSLFNVGSIFRTADGIRAAKLILTGYTGKPPRKEIDKAALGAVETVPWNYYRTSREAISELKKKDIAIVALEQTINSFDFNEYTYTFPVAIVLGNEYIGIEQETLNLCDVCVSIPMCGAKLSLNVSTSFGILGYEILSQYLKNDHF